MPVFAKVKYLTLLIIVLLSLSLLLHYIFNTWLVLRDFQVQLSSQVQAKRLKQAEPLQTKLITKYVQK